MQNNESPNDGAKAGGNKRAPLYVKMSNDKYFGNFVANELSAQILFQKFLPPPVLDQLDLSTLRTVYTREIGPEGIEKVGDVFFVVDMKEKPGKVRRRAAFVIATEHKTKDDKNIAIQLLGYISALLDRMNANREFYADAEGRLPTPYVIVFSQDENPKEEPARLSDVLWTIEGLEGTVPNFEYQTIYANQISLDEIRECEPATRTFLYLMQIANKKHTPEEDVELAATIRRLLETSTSDERTRQCAQASMNYLLHLQQRRPGMLTTPELRKEIERQKGEPMEDGLLLFFEKEVSERCEKARENGKQAGIYEIIYNNLCLKYGAGSISKNLQARVEEINYYPALEEIQSAIWTTASLASFESEITEIVNKYAEEIREINH